MRPVLKLGVRALWRGPASLQLGIDPERALVLDPVAPGTDTVLALLDGTRDRPGVVRAAGERGVAVESTERLLRTLESAALLDDAAATPPGGLTNAARQRLAPDQAHLALRLAAPGAAVAALHLRRAAHVLVVGTARLGALLAAQLAASGVGTLELVDAETVIPRDLAPGGLGSDDTGRTRAAATAAAVSRAGVRAITSETVTPEAARAARLAVLVAEQHPPRPAGALALLHAAGTPYLLVGPRGTAASVGPLVLPGTSPCPRCLDLTRSDRDPAWPALVAQLASGTHEPDPMDTALATAAASLAAAQVLAALADPWAGPVGVSLELTLAPPALAARQWAAHPRCPCGAAG